MKPSRLDSLASYADYIRDSGIEPDLISSATVPVLIVPPGWTDQRAPDRPARILVALDGSRSAERALVSSVRLAQLMPANLILIRVVRDRDAAWQSADEYVRGMAANVRSAAPGTRVAPVVTAGDPVRAILDAARAFDVDAIAMSTRERSDLARAPIGSTATAVLERSSVPIVLVGPNVLRPPVTALIRMGAAVRTLDNTLLGEVYRVDIDREQQAIVWVVGIGRGPLSREIRVPVHFIRDLDDNELTLRLTIDELDQLPDPKDDVFQTPPPPYSDTIDRTEIDRTGRVVAFWVRAGSASVPDLRIPAELIRHPQARRELRSGLGCGR